MKRHLLSALAVICFSTSHAQIPSWLPANGLVAWYPFNGNANDESNHGNNGVVYGATLAIDRQGNPNSAYSFNGTNNHIEVADAANLRVRKITIAAWVQANVAGDQMVVYKADYNTGGSENYGMDMTKRFGIKSNSNCGSGGWQYGNFGSVANVGNWEFLVGTFDGSVLRSYVNGALVSSMNYTGVMDSCVGGALRFGYGSLGLPHAFSGLMDDIAIYNRALSDCEIQQLYNQNSAAITTQPTTQMVGNGSTVHFTIATTGAGLYYQWQENNGSGFVSLSNGGIYANVTTPSLTISPVISSINNAIYRCIVGSTIACPDTSFGATLLIDFSGVGEVNKEHELTVSPNPATDIVNVACGSFFDNKKYWLVNQFGQTVLEGKVHEGMTLLNIKELATGIYYLRIHGGNKPVRIVKL